MVDKRRNWNRLEHEEGRRGPREEESWTLEEAVAQLFEVLIPERAARDGVPEEEAQRLILEEWQAEWDATPRGIELVGR